ncbi:MAG TPA: hypothetical protein VFR93_06200 [Candidatus Limnocylindrales bacterium]|nr:hypothetical protein [Candidatus Limnocylindrales bacterium]
MELLVGALVVLAFVAILIRFAFRDASGQFRLPRIVDQSVGMWILRRMLGRPTDPDMDPFARFRRPSTVIGRRPGAPPRPARRAATRGAGPTASAASRSAAPTASTPAGSTARPAAPAVLRDATGSRDEDALPPAWTTIERRRTEGRPFGASILEPPPPPPARSRARAGVTYGVLFVAVALGGLAVGALAGLASGGSGLSTSASPLASEASASASSAVPSQ